MVRPQKPQKNTNKALFLDRDGVINKDRSYPYLPQHIEFMEGIFELCTAAMQRQYLLIVITNQSGIARGHFTEQDVAALHAWMQTQFANRCITINAWYFCPYHKDAVVTRYRKDSYDRKPNPGMVEQAAADFDLDLSSSLMLGDKPSDRIQHPALRSILLKSEYLPDGYDIESLFEATAYL